MTTVELKEELHANTRRTRITYRGQVDGQAAAIKCYRKPLFGLIHWLRAVQRGRKIRRAGGPVPAIVYAGWLGSERCFCFATSFLVGYEPLRSLLQQEPARERQLGIVSLLGEAMADIHHKGIEQPDGNLTNFLLSPNDQLAMVDEDDIRVYRRRLPLSLAVSNLANVAARLPDKVLVEALLSAYLRAASGMSDPVWDHGLFWQSVEDWKNRLESKRTRRNIAATREFD